MSKPIVALVGRPNVGKSTLFNRLIGERLAVVDGVPGTTRDRLMALAEWRSIQFHVVDTGGIDPTHTGQGQQPLSIGSADFIEQIRQQAEAAIRTADAVLFMTDAIDEFWLPIQGDFKGKKFKSVTRGSTELSKVASGKKEQEKPANNVELTEKLLVRLKEILAGEVKDVCLSERLVDSPVCLVAPENDVDIHLQRLLKKSQGYEAVHQHILEINDKHPVIMKLKNMVANDAAAEIITDTAFLLLDQARIIEGEPLKNPAEFVRRL